MSLQGVKPLFLSVGVSVLKSPRVLFKMQICTKTIWIRIWGIYISISPQVIVFHQRPISLLKSLAVFLCNWAVLLRVTVGGEERSREPSEEGTGKTRNSQRKKKRRKRLTESRLEGKIHVLFHSFDFWNLTLERVRGCFRTCSTGEQKKKIQTQTIGKLKVQSRHRPQQWGNYSLKLLEILQEIANWKRS